MGTTNYPHLIDDLTTLGGPFIDVAPVVDPFRNIGASFRNNANAALLAVQTRLGVYCSLNTTSVDWGLLTTGTTPNQGLRFAGSHVAWPGLQVEAGLFIDSANSHVSFHKSGDPVATFTDLTAGGGGASTWDAIYATDKHLAITGLPLTFEQTSITGHGFVVSRSGATTDAALLFVSSINGADSQPSILASGTAQDTSKNVASIVAVSSGLSGGSEKLVGVYSAVTKNASDASGSEVVSFYATVSGSGGSDSIGVSVGPDFLYGVRSESPAFITSSHTNAFWPSLLVSHTGDYSSDFLIIAGVGSLPALFSPVFFLSRAGNLGVLSHSSDGYLIDGRVVGVEGSELLVDHDMEKTTTSDWTVVNGAILSKDTVTVYEGVRSLAVKENIFGDPPSPNPAAQQSVLTIGNRYKLTGHACMEPGTNDYPAVYNGTMALWTGTSSTAWQSFTQEFVAKSTDIKLVKISVDHAEITAYFDLFSVVEVESADICTFQDSYGNTRFKVKNTGNTLIEGIIGNGTPLLELSQFDFEEPFIRFKGLSSPGGDTNISTLDDSSFVSADRWVAVDVDGTKYWVKLHMYTPT